MKSLPHLAFILLLLPTPSAFAAAVAIPPMVIERVQPTHAPPDGTVVLSIMGSQLNAATVSIGTVPAEVLPGSTDAIVRVKIPAGLATGTQIVDVSSSWGFASGSVVITEPGMAPGPVVERIDAERYPPPPTSEMCLDGRYFVEGAHITIGNEPVPEVRFVSGERLCTTTPDYPDDGTPLDITVINPDNRTASIRLFTGGPLWDDEDCACTTVTRSTSVPASRPLGLLFLAMGLAFWRRR